MPDDLCADLYQTVAQRRHGPPLRFLGQRQRTQEVGEVVGQCVQLQPHGVGGEVVTGQARPGDRVLALLDVLLCCAAMIVEHHYALGRASHVGDDEPDARIQFTGMPFHLRDYTTGLGPGASLVAEAGVIAVHLLRRISNRALQQPVDALLQDGIGRQAKWLL